jgi:DNA-binding NarL/FixJ family response regulator
MGACGKILVVDDDPGFCALVVSIAKEAGYEACGAARGEDALRLARDEPPDVAVLDIELPGISGYEVCRRLREESGPAGIIFVSGTQTGPLDRTAGLLVGADDYLVKPFAPDELLARIRLLIRSRTVPGPAPGENGSRLTPREREVLALLADGACQAEIAGKLVISSRTVAAHIDHILQKLGVHSRAQAVAAAYRDGLLGG